MIFPEPITVTKSEPDEIRIEWDDGHISLHPRRNLRLECACAFCVSEDTGQRLIDEAAIPDDLTVLSGDNVGRYGIKFFFSDGHNDGIFTWKRLRELCRCDECRNKQLDSLH